MIRDSFLAVGHPAVPLSRSVQTGFRRERRNALLLALAVLLGGIALTFGSSHALQRAELREFETVFDLDADRYLNGIARDLRANEVLLRGATGLFAASDVVTASEWSIYVSRLNSGPSAFGTLGMGYSQRVAPALRGTFEASMRAGGYPDFAITPAGEREQLQAITHLAPRDKGNDKALGVDLLADPVLGTSIERARDSGQIVLTPSVPLPFGPAAHPAALLIEPVYLDSMPRDNLQQRAQAFIGFTFVLVDIESLARVGLDGLNPAHHVRIIDKTEMPARELFSSDPGHPMRGQTLTAQRTLDAFGRSLTLEFDRHGGLDSEIRGSSIALPSGILASLLLALLTWHLGSSRARVQSQVRRMTRDLRQSELGLQQSQALLSSVINGLPSGVVLKNEALQISLANRAFCDLLGCTAAEAVGRYCADVVDPSLARRLDASDLATLESGQEHVSELVLGTSDGKPRAFLVRKVSLPGDAPQVLAIYTDITERRQAEERLRTSEMRWQSALEGAGDAVWDWNMVTGKLFLSRRWKQILGYTEAEVGDDLDEFSSRLHPEDRQRVFADVEDHIQGRTDVYSSEFRIRRKDGGYLWVIDRGRIVERDAHGRPTRMIGRFSDISERKKAEQALSESEARFRLMADSTPHLIWVADESRGCTYFNRTWLEFTGRTLDQERGEGWTEGVHPDDCDRCLSLYDTAFGQRRAFETEYRLRRHDGEYRWVFNTGVPRFSASGEFAGYIGSCIDITDRRRMEAELRHNRDLLDAINRFQDEFIRDPDSNRVFENMLARLLANARCELGMIGDAQVDADGNRVMRALAVSKLAVDAETGELRQDNASHALALRDLATLFGAVPASDDPVIADDSASEPGTGKLCPTLPALENFASLPIRSGDELLGMVGLANRLDGFNLALMADLDPLLSTCAKLLLARRSDVARKQAEAELARHRDNLREMVEEQTRDARVARDEAQRANQAKSAFLANMSHELRTPMHAILAFAKLGKTRAAQDDAHKLNDYFGRIRASGDRLLALLNDLLDLSKLEAGKMVLDLRPCALDRLVREVAREFDEVFKAKGVQLRVQGETALAEVALDYGRIGQVLRNLLSNAVKFTPQDRTVDIRCGACELPLGRRRDDQGLTQPGVEIVISDEGIGIPPTELERVFDKFVQSSRTRTGAGGTGLGLAISREIVEAHRGRIFARNNAKGGTDFVVRLPSDPSCPESHMQENQE
jgi:PAS domain S-box-containing protein